MGISYLRRGIKKAPSSLICAVLSAGYLPPNMRTQRSAKAFPIAPPIEPMLAKLADTLPAAGTFLFEPKWDGFRAIVFRGASDVFIQSPDPRPAPQREPRAPLERLLADSGPPVYLTPMTRDRNMATQWLEQFEGAGLDGGIAKPAGGPHHPGQRGRMQGKGRG